MEAERARLERVRPGRAPTLKTTDPDAFLNLEVDRPRAVAETLVEDMVVAKAQRRG